MNEPQRPDPDALLARTREDNPDPRRGALKIYFGYAAGVGKTYSMLDDARRARDAGRDVVAGYVEPHGRAETEALLDGLEALPTRPVEYRGVTLREFDADAALARRPGLLLVDELAHTNAAGSRHEKRWQDVEELLEAGIDVWTTMNVQHIESLNDIVGQITGVVVRETVPDRVFDRADDLELADLTPEELLARLRQGKVYLPEQARRAAEGFFRKSNLAALRELSLRQAARRLHTDVESARRERAADGPWATEERLLVCVGPSPTTARVIRTARRMAAAFDAPWVAVSVDLSGATADSPARRQIARHFRLAERLGAETATIPGPGVVGTILDYARARNVTKILVGQTRQPRWRRLLFGTVVDELLEQCGPIDVHVIHGEAEPSEAEPPTARRAADVRPYARSAAAVAVAALVAVALQSLRVADAEANTVMIFLAAVAWSAFRDGRGPAAAASVLAVLAFDFLFVPPLYTFVFADVQYVVTFAVMLTIGLVVGTLTARLRGQVESTRRREERTAALYELGRQLASLSGDAFLAAATGRRIAGTLGGEAAVYLSRTGGPPEVVYGGDSAIARHAGSEGVAQWVIDRGQLAGAGTSTLPDAAALFLPLAGSQGTPGGLAVRTPEPARLLDPDTRPFLEACANLLALALERDRHAVDAAEARLQRETEQVRSSLLSSVSHDLKTPLAGIAGASSSLLESTSLDESTRRELLETVAEEAARLNRLLENVLQMSRLDAGAAPPNRQWHVLEEIVGSALHRTRDALVAHVVDVGLPADLPLVYVDGLLVEQLLLNLFENVARHTPAVTRVTVSAAFDARGLRVVIADDGPGLPHGSEERVFDKFYRATPTADGGRGSGLGLAIARAVARVHGGDLTASNRAGGGAEFVLRLPHRGDAPRVEVG